MLQVKPVNDDTTSTMNVQTSGGSTILAVDTSNSLVKVGATQVHATTMYKEFGICDFELNQGYHVPLIAHNNMLSDNGDDYNIEADFGDNGADPETDYNVGTAGGAQYVILSYWYIMDNITVDAVSVIGQLMDGTARTFNYHLMKYDYDTTTGNLTNGLVIGDATDELSLTTIPHVSLSLTGANVDVDSGQVVIAFVESVDVNEVQTTVLMTVKYHIR